MSAQSVQPLSPPARSLTLAQRSNFLALTVRSYDTWRVRSLTLLTGQAFALEQEFQLLKDWLQPKPEQRCLDVGTSTGNYARVLAEHGCNVTAIDISAGFLQHAKGLAINQNVLPRIQFEEANAEAMPYPDAHFDAIAIGATINEFHDTQTALLECARVLAPGGKLFCMYLAQAQTPLGRRIQQPLQWLGVRYPQPEDLARVLQTQGLVRQEHQRKRNVCLELYQKKPVSAQ